MAKADASIKQPALRPPAWVFGPVWTALYGLMGYASYRAYSAGTSGVGLGSAPEIAAKLAENTVGTPTELALSGATLYTLQLGLNLAWMPLFFGAKRPIEATVDIAALLGLNIYLAGWVWRKVDTVAAWCLVPYIAWLGFATYMSAGAGYLNDWDISAMDTKGKGKSVEKKDGPSI